MAGDCFGLSPDPKREMKKIAISKASHTGSRPNLKTVSVRNRRGCLVLLMMILMSASALLYNDANAHAARSSALVPPAADTNALIAVEHDHCRSPCDAGDQARQQGDCGCICACGCALCPLPTAEAPIDVLQRELHSVGPCPVLLAARVAPQLRPPRRIVIV